ncbi:amino acid permease C-terminal domain-containing protein, partial [Priestia megaterium]
RGFTMPFVPVLPILSVLSCLFLMINLPKTTWLYFSIWIVLGIFVYVGYSRKHSRLTSKEMKKAS